ncbi:hypothetical protein AURDEDRAFT_184648 [Auricularia subglabra TFB-10046 SS5]|nr:hypothetical protein AURDEDRAFT_184648 [Auricularia subglabra TFB-10046 SS5]
MSSLPEEERLSPSEDNVSESSTVLYDQEPYEQYKHRVRALLSELYDDSTAKRAEISRMEGRGHNRIIGIALPSGNGGPERLVLRIPRFDVDAEETTLAATVVLAALKASVPVPEVIRFDPTPKNALERQYTLMRRLPGFCLNDIFYYLPAEDKCALAVQISRTLHNIMTVCVPPGIGPLRTDSQGQLRLGWYEGGSAAAPAPETFSNFVCSRLQEQRDFLMECPPGWRFRLELYDRLKAAAQVLLRDAALSGRNVLFHTDFAARNILVEQSPTGEWQITGVLDWDGAQTAPYEIACVCPVWLWAGADEPDGNVHEYYFDPDEPVSDEDCARIRETFVDEMERLEPGFMAAVRQTRDRCLRKIYELARDGFHSNEDMDALDRIEALATKLGNLPGSRVDPPGSLP